MQATTLTSDRIFLLTYLFWMVGGCLLVIPVVLTALSAGELFSVRWRESAELFIHGALVPFGKNLAVLLATFGVSAMLFLLGLREREVVLPGDGTVRIRWGTRAPLTLRTVRAAALEDFNVAREARFAMSARATGRHSLRQMPDRWRLMAKANGRGVDLGSYATEEQARKAIAAIRAASQRAA